MLFFCIFFIILIFTTSTQTNILFRLSQNHQIKRTMKLLPTPFLLNNKHPQEYEQLLLGKLFSKHLPRTGQTFVGFFTEFQSFVHNIFASKSKISPDKHHRTNSMKPSAQVTPQKKKSTLSETTFAHGPARIVQSEPPLEHESLYTKK